MVHYDPLYVQFIYFFNDKKDYYECHEVLEELWLEEGRSPLLQGLLQAAVALYHYSYGNVSGAVKLFRGALQKLSEYRKIELGIDLRRFRNDCELYLKRLENVDAHPFDFYSFAIQIVDPKLAEQVDKLKKERASDD